MSAPSGRSPFTGRTRRQRTSYGSAAADTSEDASMATSTSPFGGLLSQGGRLSPAAGWSPANTRSRRRFFDNDERITTRQRNRLSSDGGVLGTAIPAPPASTTKSNHATSSNSRNTKSNSNSEEMVDEMDLQQLRSLAVEALGNSTVTASPGMAVFCASVLYSKTLQAEDAYLYAQALHTNGEYRRCVRLLEKASLNNNYEAILLAAQSLASLGEWDECLVVLENATGHVEDDDEGAWEALVSAHEQSNSKKIHPLARLCLWRGRAYDETSHPTRAALYWKRALLIDSRCVEALDAMLQRSVVTPQEAHDLLSRLQFDSGLEWLRHVYLARLDLPPENTKENKQPPNSFFGGQQIDASSIQHDATMTPSSTSVLVDNIWEPKEDDRKQPAKQHAQESISHDVDAAFTKLWTVHKLHQSPEVLSLAAIRSYRRYNLPAALSYCQALANVDPLCPTASYVYVATLVGLNKKRLLFGLAHEWVEASPKSARSWFAVGAYYYACQKYHLAQRHFCRATRLEPHSTEAWIAFGCAFAACDESDQALASFRAAQRLAPAQHSSMMYMGMEYLRTNHLVLAHHFLTAALRSSGGDPLCYHELGVAAWNKKEYKEAIACFDRALRSIVETASDESSSTTKSTTDCIHLVQDDFWEPTLFNLGQCYRKTRHFAEAAHCFEKCLALCPGNASSYAALGFTKHLTGNLDGAIELYHQALSRKPDDPFSSDMLNRALEEALSNIQISGEDSTTGGGNSFMNSDMMSPPPPSSSFLSPDGMSSTSSILQSGVSTRRYNLRRRRTSASMATDEGSNLSFASDDVDMSMT